MSTAVIILRALALLAFAAPALILASGRRGGPQRLGSGDTSSRAPVVANFVAAALFFPSLLLWRSDVSGPHALALATAGCLLAVAGTAMVVVSRKALGAAWSLVAKADQAIGLVSHGPYRVVRHPIYLGLILLGAGQAIAFGSGPAGAIVAFGLLPTFIWRAAVEERLLAQMFGQHYADYRTRTRLIIPGIL